MKKLENCLLGIEIEEKCFNYLKEELQKKYEFGLFNDLLSLPCMQYDVKSKLSLLLAVIEDGECNDAIAEKLCYQLANVSEQLWRNFKERLEMLIEPNNFTLNRNHLLKLANTLEIMYAKGYGEADYLTRLIYERIQQTDVEFNTDSDENVRIKLAKIAYSTTKYNFDEKIKAIDTVKYHLKSSGRKYLLGVLNYYKGMCLKTVGIKLDYKDDIYYIMKSKARGFDLATIYLNYSSNNIETSSEYQK